MHWMCRPWMDKFIEKEKSVLFVVIWKKNLGNKNNEKKRNWRGRREQLYQHYFITSYAYLMTSIPITNTNMVRFNFIFQLWGNMYYYFVFVRLLLFEKHSKYYFTTKAIHFTNSSSLSENQNLKKRFLADPWMRLLSYSSFNILFQKSFEVGSSGKAIRFLLK